MTFRLAAATSASPAMAMATYLTDEANHHELAQKLAQYYGESMTALVAGVPRQDMHPLVAEKLGIDPGKGLSTEQIANLLMGNRSDGARIPGKQIQKNTDDKVRTAYIDLTLQAPKSFSVALALAKTERERAILDLAFRRAVDRIMVDIEDLIGVARKGKGGRDGHEKGHIGWLAFHHFSARPTTMIATKVDGQDATEIAAVKVVGDPHRHAHVIVPNVVVTDEGRVTSLHLMRMHERVHELGGVFQGYLGVELRKEGVEFELDSDTTKSMRARRGRLVAIPRWLEALYSKRSTNGEEAAKKFAADRGLDWDVMSPNQRIQLLRTSIKVGRQSKEGPPDFEAWMQEAVDAGYQHGTVLRPDNKQTLAHAETRQHAAYETSLPILAPELERRGVFQGALAREAAAMGFIQWGIQSIKELDVVTRAYRTEGVLQDGVKTHLKWGRYEDTKWAQFTTGLHIAQEREAISLLQAAAGNTTQALSVEAVEAAAQRLAVERDYDFTSEQGKLQLDMARRLGPAGGAVIGVGVAGAGKGVVLGVLAEAAHDLGYRTIGTTVAWRQAAALADSGVGKRKSKRPVRHKEADTKLYEQAKFDKADAFALTKFLDGLQKGYIKADDKTIVFMDEIAQVGTRQILHLARFQAKFGFRIIGLGDDRQCQSIDAGSTVKLFRKALGDEQIPELLETVRQEQEEDRVTSLLFREGKVPSTLLALERKLAAGTLHVVPGGYNQAIQAAVDMWERRTAEIADDPKATVAISVPTNHDAREIGTEIRRRRVARAINAGEGLGQAVALDATDQSGATFTLEVVRGDRVRLFREVKNADGSFGYNGTTVEVVSIDPASGMTMRRDDGREMTVSWNSLRHRETGRIMLTYGYALTIDSRQGDTVSYHITVMPEGSSAVNAYKAYTGDSRHRIRSDIITSQGQELQEIADRRPLNDPRNEDTRPEQLRVAIMNNMARNLARHPEKALATDFDDNARDLHVGTVDAERAAWNSRADKRPAKAARRQRRAERAAEPTAEQTVNALVQHQGAVKKATQQVAQAPKPSRTTKPTRAPRTKQEAPSMTQAEARAEFARKLESIGLVLSDRQHDHPKADGAIHYVSTIGAKKGSKRGTYSMSNDGRRGWGVNHATKERVTWSQRANTVRKLSPEELRQKKEQERAAREQAINAQRQREEEGALQAMRVWSAARPTQSHPYLKKKGVRSHGLRVAAPGTIVTLNEGKERNIGGRLLVPMVDEAGKLWNVQTIDATGKSKFYLPGRKQGLFFDLSPAEPGEPMILATGYATGATLLESTALSTRITFDDTNLVYVGKATRAVEPDRPLFFAGDNDHHLSGIQRNIGADERGVVRMDWPASVTGDAHKGNTIQYRLAGMPDWIEARRGVDQSRTSIEIQGLRPGARYEVRMFAEHRQMPLPNSGVEKATQAARLTGGKTIIPSFQPGDKGTDWNDWATQHGGTNRAARHQAVRKAFEAENIRMPDLKPEASTARASITQADRDRAMQQAARDRQRQAQSVQEQQRRQQEQQRQALAQRPSAGA